MGGVGGGVTARVAGETTRPTSLEFRLNLTQVGKKTIFWNLVENEWMRHSYETSTQWFAFPLLPKDGIKTLISEVPIRFTAKVSWKYCIYTPVVVTYGVT